jgi:hypothetical protein
MNCQWICAQAWINDGLSIAMAKGIQDIVNAEEPDAMESADDYKITI